MQFLSFSDPQMTATRYPPPPDGKYVILRSPDDNFRVFYPPRRMANLSFGRPADDSFRVFYPPLMGNLPFWDPQITLSGCSTPPPDAISVLLGSPDDSFWVS